jgi:hypothetical protein
MPDRDDTRPLRRLLGALRERNIGVLIAGLLTLVAGILNTADGHTFWGLWGIIGGTGLVGLVIVTNLRGRRHTTAATPADER